MKPIAQQQWDDKLLMLSLLLRKRRSKKARSPVFRQPIKWDKFCNSQHIPLDRVQRTKATKNQFAKPHKMSFALLVALQCIQRCLLILRDVSTLAAFLMLTHVIATRCNSIHRSALEPIKSIFVDLTLGCNARWQSRVSQEKGCKMSEGINVQANQ